MTTFTSEDRQEAYQKKVEEAPYHPGYEDAAITPRSDPVYKGMDPAKMIWKSKPLTDEEIEQIAVRYYVGSRILPIQYARAIEERHGIK